VFIMPCPVCNYVHKIVLQIYVYFLHILTLMWSIAFSLSRFLSMLCNLIADGFP
jgi:hypothetical protein